VTATDSPGSIDSDIIHAVDFLNLMVYDMGYPHSTYEHARSSLSHWRWIEGLPKEKMILGLPFYSHKDWVSYRDVIARYTTSAAQIDHAGGLDYNGQPTIRAKTELAKKEAGGVMFWELSQDTQDDTSLLMTIWSVAGSLTQQPSPAPPP
jgi:GH18 family chitinase